MASIIKRKNSYCVVYRYTDEKGKSHQRWESFPTNAEARKRKIKLSTNRTTMFYRSRSKNGQRIACRLYGDLRREQMGNVHL